MVNLDHVGDSNCLEDEIGLSDDEVPLGNQTEEHNHLVGSGNYSEDPSQNRPEPSG